MERKESVGKCLSCGYEWWAVDRGQNAPSRCPHCKKRYVAWKRECTDKQLKAHMPEDLKNEITGPLERIVKDEKDMQNTCSAVQKTENDGENVMSDEIHAETPAEHTICSGAENSATTEKTAEMAQNACSSTQKFEIDSGTMIKNSGIAEKDMQNTCSAVQKMEIEKFMAQKKEHPVKRQYRKRQMETEPEYDDYDGDDWDFPYGAGNQGWIEAKQSAPKINPMGIIFVIAGIAIVGGVIYFLRKGKGVVHQAPAQTSVQQAPRIKPETISNPRIGGMVR